MSGDEYNSDREREQRRLDRETGYAARDAATPVGPRLTPLEQKRKRASQIAGSFDDDPPSPDRVAGPHPMLSQPWGDPDFDPSCVDCREGRHGRLAASPSPDRVAGLREAAQLVVSLAHPSSEFPGRFIVHRDDLSRLRAALLDSEPGLDVERLAAAAREIAMSGLDHYPWSQAMPENQEHWRRQVEPLAAAYARLSENP